MSILSVIYTFWSWDSLLPWPALAAMFICGIALLLLARRRVRGSTLREPMTWSVVSWAAVCGIELLFAERTPDAVSSFAAWRFAAAVSTICPMMAVLGAKRPQNKAWQFVVATLWMILAAPALESNLFGAGGAPHLGTVRGWFMWGMILLGPANYLFTKYAAASLLFAGGQCMLLSTQLPVLQGSFDGDLQIAGVPLLFASMLVAATSTWIPLRGDYAPQQIWLEFRDGWGAFWALRVAERFNLLAGQNNWPIVLRWRGLIVINDTQFASQSSAGVLGAANRTSAPADGTVGDSANGIRQTAGVKEDSALLDGQPQQISQDSRAIRELRSLLGRFVAED